MTPAQKAEIVEMVKKHSTSITMAIGDGANDVNMIKSENLIKPLSHQKMFIDLKVLFFCNSGTYRCWCMRCGGQSSGAECGFCSGAVQLPSQAAAGARSLVVLQSLRISAVFPLQNQRVRSGSRLVQFLQWLQCSGRATRP